MPNLTYQEERWADCWKEIDPLWQAHAEETGLDIQPDNTGYAALDARDFLILITLRVDGHLVGIHRSILGPNLHHLHEWYAVGDGWFIIPAYRRGWAAYRLLQYAEDAARKRGCAFLYQASPCWHALDSLLKRAGWQATDTLYRKEL